MESKEPVFFIAQVMKNGGGQEKPFEKVNGRSRLPKKCSSKQNCQVFAIPPGRLTAGTYRAAIWKGISSSKPPWLCSMLIFQGASILPILGMFDIHDGMKGVSWCDVG